MKFHCQQEKNMESATKDFTNMDSIFLYGIVWNENESLGKFIFIFFLNIFKSKEDWKMIAKILNRKASDCVFKFHAMRTTYFRTSEWAPEEEKLLSDIVK